MKIVIDTNVLLSALFSKNGTSHKLLTWILDKHKQNHQILVVSNTLVIEYQAVFTRNENLLKCKTNKQEILKFIDDICLISQPQKINFIWRPFLKDSADDMVLETAFNAGAEYIITYNIKDFSNIENSFDIKICTAKDFLIIMGVLK
ncbi:hypothetical protein SPONN_1697 [uncultured Candidatus Thioglobus sp.]|nr:hypothetical protein SPONN_1697 [uncultured Candidatus Thioglobus sp.]